MSGRFCGLTPVVLISTVAPETTVEGFAVQLMVGGSNAFTVKGAEQLELSLAFLPEDICEPTV